MNGDLISLQAKLVEMEETGCAALTMVPKWSARFDALVQYSKALERAVEKLGLDSVEPKAIEYVRSMGDMVRYCADELKKESAKELAKEEKENQERQKQEEKERLRKEQQMNRRMKYRR